MREGAAAVGGYCERPLDRVEEEGEGEAGFVIEEELEEDD